MERAYVIALDAGRKDLQTIAAQALASGAHDRLELDEAELLLTRALELAGESGSVRARISATLAYAWFLRVKGELDAARDDDGGGAGAPPRSSASSRCSRRR